MANTLCGYEASPRMSELMKMYEDLFIVGRDGRFRTLSINWDYEKIQDFIDMYQEEKKPIWRFRK